MKHLCIIIFLMIGISLAYSQSEETLVKRIREHFNIINANLENFDLIEDELEDESTEGATMKSYFDNGKLVLLHCEFYGEMGNLKEEYYFKEKKLVFVYSVRTNYTAPVYTENVETLNLKKTGIILIMIK